MKLFLVPKIMKQGKLQERKKGKTYQWKWVFPAHKSQKKTPTSSIRMQSQISRGKESIFGTSRREKTGEEETDTTVHSNIEKMNCKSIPDLRTPEEISPSVTTSTFTPQSKGKHENSLIGINPIDTSSPNHRRLDLNNSQKAKNINTQSQLNQSKVPNVEKI
ncbi:uncharacterized protein [Venturia canescens]|uniref:uncharacterized protein n=1 Tax=Venturia canescens TaxID=32260 RepID=UPI001C9D486B|nr:uncharacterized protein LOC122412839 [Venturia canescens]XP_043286119.1 uncharacterized protein LOC122416995 [Venturia canescens]XP_043287694.1 uncharacterized protein LOC122417885 [Venturia canescens]